MFDRSSFPIKTSFPLEVEGRSQHFMATLDSRSVTIDNGYQLAIAKESYAIQLVRLNNENFLNTLRKNSVGDWIRN